MGRTPYDHPVSTKVDPLFRKCSPRHGLSCHLGGEGDRPFWPPPRHLISKFWQRFVITFSKNIVRKFLLQPSSKDYLGAWPTPPLASTSLHQFQFCFYPRVDNLKKHFFHFLFFGSHKRIFRQSQKVIFSTVTKAYVDNCQSCCRQSSSLSSSTWQV